MATVKSMCRVFVSLGALGVAVSAATAAVPPAIEAGLVKIGPIVDPLCTARLYRPLMPADDIGSGHAQPYAGIKVSRNIAFGPDPKDVVDVFEGDKGGASRTVLVFIPGGGGDKTEIQDKAANAFYDNIGRWAVKQGFVGVLMQRKGGAAWDAGGRDVSAMLSWVQANIAKHHGNAQQVYLWAHSAGNVPMGTYLGRPELYTKSGVGVRGAIFMSGAPFNLAPVPEPAMDMGAMFGTAGKSCGEVTGFAAVGGAGGALPGVAPGHPGGPPMGPPFGAPPPQVSPAELLARSSLPALRKAPFRMLIVNGEMDPPVLVESGKKLHDALCEGGNKACPEFVIAKGHSHMSLVFSIDTPDDTVSAPVLQFIKGNLASH